MPLTWDIIRFSVNFTFIYLNHNGDFFPFIESNIKILDPVFTETYSGGDK